MTPGRRAIAVLGLAALATFPVTARQAARGGAAQASAAQAGADQAAQERSSQIFRGGTDTVFLNVTVVDAAGHLVGGLTADDFEVYEDNVRQKVENFAADPQPIALSILFDTSTSMDQKLEIAQAAAIGFVRRLGPHDEAQIVDFDSQVTVRQQYTNDVAALEKAIRSTQAGGSTSLYMALYTALKDRDLRPEAEVPGGGIRRFAIVVLSDGEDTTSRLDYEEVLDGAKRSDSVVYAIGLRAPDESRRTGFRESEFVLRTLSQETGGRVFFVDDAKQLPDIYEQIATELANQYAIGYTSTNTRRDGTWRTVQVRVSRPGTVARTRAGYFAAKGRP
ncbi:MAG: VWA domain-containing protein [Vicinamibacterales bacterium]